MNITARSRVIIFVMITFLLAGCNLPKPDHTAIHGQGRNYIHFDCQPDSTSQSR